LRIVNAEGSRTIYDHHLGTRPLLRRCGFWRTGAFLVLNMIGFVAANLFWMYLSGRGWIDFSAEAYRADLATPLGDTLLHPLSVMSHPWMIPVTGILLGAIIFVPLLAAILYPLVFAFIFAMVVAACGHAPVLAGALGCGCIIAARTPLRSDMPFCAFILGLVPVGLYLWLLGFSDSQLAEVLPLQRWVLAGSMIVAVVVGILSSASCLALAKGTGFKPGVILPFLILLLGSAGAVFHFKVGPDQLAYALIADQIDGGDIIFQPVKLDQWREKHDAEGLNRRTLENRLRDELQRRQRELTERCRMFLDRYGESDRASAVLWIQAQSRSLQLDVPIFDAGVVRYSASFPLPESAHLWERMREDFPGTPHAALGDWRIGEMALRDKKPDHADRLLRAAEGALRGFLVSTKGPSKTELAARVFRTPESIPVPAYYTEALFRIRRLIWLMDRNNILDDAEASEALGALLDENPHGPRYEERLGNLAGNYEQTPIGDNLKLAVAMATDDPYTQAEMLIWLAADERTDAAVEANYHLGMLVKQTARARALMLIPEIKKPEEYFQIVIAAPDNPWQSFAREHLGRLAGRSASSE